MHTTELEEQPFPAPTRTVWNALQTTADAAAAERTVHLDGHRLTLEEVAAVARGGARVEVDPEPAVRARIEESHRLNRELIAEGLPIYGVTTGVGDSVGRQISPERTAALQKYVVAKCGCGTGPTLPEDQTRAVVLVRANCLVRGYSGIRPLLIERLLDMLNLDLLPRIPEQGSVGASGDLVPGSYVAAAVSGKRRVLFRGEEMPAAEAWAAVGKEPLELEAKEGLALINGTMVMSGIAALAAVDAERVARTADVCTALACEALRGMRGPFDPFLHQVKPHTGQVCSARRIRTLLEGSEWTRPYQSTVADLQPIEGGFRELPLKIQDKYSLRCAPHAIGVLYDAVEWITRWLETEINSSNDNPLYDLETRRVHSGGNFSGFHVGLAMDSLKTAVASVADLLDRQMALLVDEKFNGLTPNLIPPLPEDHPEKGVLHGFKAVQIAMSALTAEALQRALPMSIFSRSTECHNQDKVSMATTAARQARDVVELTERCCAIHLLAACQAVDVRRAIDGGDSGEPEELGRTRAVYDKIRTVSPFVDRDRELEDDIYAVAEMVHGGALLAGLGD